tara:strand:+ start:4068 stop:4313 length:246 start_codon:yes stop_codon:yes gene_type:complete
MKRLFILLVAIVLCGCQFHKAPNGKYFPYGWGAPPEIQTKDYVKLPDNYGYGSSTLKNWIQLNKDRDMINKSLNNLPSSGL